MLAVVMLALLAPAGDRGNPSLKTVRGGRIQIGRDVWLVEEMGFWESGDADTGGELPFNLKITKNKRTALIRSEGGSFKIIRAHTPAGFPIFIAKTHSWCGHGETTHLYGLKDGIVKDMASLPDGEIGGPVFRDMDRDGIKEWIFDDYDWYLNYEEPANNLYFFKLQPSGTLRLWKKLPNTQKTRLPRDPRFYF